jgi:hypothetical protein
MEGTAMQVPLQTPGPRHLWLRSLAFLAVSAGAGALLATLFRWTGPTSWGGGTSGLALAWSRLRDELFVPNLEAAALLMLAAGHIALFGRPRAGAALDRLFALRLLPGTVLAAAGAAMLWTGHLPTTEERALLAAFVGGYAALFVLILWLLLGQAAAWRRLRPRPGQLGYTVTTGLSFVAGRLLCAVVFLRAIELRGESALWALVPLFLGLAEALAVLVLVVAAAVAVRIRASRAEAAEPAA